MKILIRLILLFAVMLVPVSGCKNEEKKDGFGGFSRMVKERDDHRNKNADRKATRETAPSDKKRAAAAGVKPAGGDRKASTVQRVVILTEEGRRMLGRGIVYLDENGKIIGIRVQ